MKMFFRVLFPSICIFIFTWICSFFPFSKILLLGIYVLFPLAFIIQGIICARLIKQMIIGFICSSAAIIIPVSYWFEVGSMVNAVILYTVLGLISFFLYGRKVKSA
ncbi:hypothetical protein CKF48_08435 [Cytobacillus kochii]|uniref:Uncharacterized protein n=1 Tax=Cytobacillus kochii TaxID=859143 RepID=A0A248TGL9_9BACI|nr:hypothetical protein CKF48_08435 [Cytobacillus kochii]